MATGSIKTELLIDFYWEFYLKPTILYGLMMRISRHLLFRYSLINPKGKKFLGFFHSETIILIISIPYPSKLSRQCPIATQAFRIQTYPV